jgi:uncharacterized protein (DUF1778 family)
MPKSSPGKDSRLDLRVSQVQKELLEKAAAIKGLSLSAYTLAHLVPIAEREIATQERLVLSNSDRDLFLSVMENPPALKGKLKTAIQNYQQKYGE